MNRLSGNSACLIVLAVYWLICINHLKVEWSVNEQYNYGWAVPFLCAYLLWRRWRHLPNAAPSAPEPAPLPSRWPVIIAAVLAALFFPTRLMEEANPEWRLVSWLLALEVIGLSLCALWLFQGRQAVSALWFPLAFFLVSVPWLRPIENWIIQTLSGLSSACSVIIVNAAGEPAIQHGNTIETVAGMVGIDEACSGIRSFQACLMIGLFLGEYYLLRFGPRLVSCLAAGLLALGLNACRTAVLVWVASNQGMAAVDRWHDPTGVSILLGCFFTVWLLAVWMRRCAGASVSRCVGNDPVTGALAHWRSGAPRFITALAGWLLVTEIGTEAWYRFHEMGARPLVEWTVAWPKDNPTFKELSMSAKSRTMLRFDEGQSVTWRETGGIAWHAFYMRWLPGRVWVQMVSDHNPSICLAGVGRELLPVPQLGPVTIHGLSLRFRTFKFMERGRAVYTFHTLWEDRAGEQRTVLDRVTTRDRFGSVWEGRRNPGQRVLEITVWGIDDLTRAQAELEHQLQKLICLPRAGPAVNPGR